MKEFLKTWGRLILALVTPIIVGAYGFVLLQMDARYDDRYASKTEIIQIENGQDILIKKVGDIIRKRLEVHGHEYQHMTALESVDYWVSRREFEKRLERSDEEINRRFDELLQAIIRVEGKIE